jgi:hypothetical protein
MIYGSWPKKGIDYGQLAIKVYFVDQLLQKPKHMENFGKAHFININFLWNHNQSQQVHRTLDNNKTLNSI